MTRTELYRELRKQGMTYREIAAQCGVSYQAVAQVCAKGKETQFRKINPKSCVYPVLREWMNSNYVSRAELYRRMHDGHPCVGCAPKLLNERLTGKTMWRIDEIDRLLDITGMTYEELFWRGRHGDSSTENGLDGG